MIAGWREIKNSILPYHVQVERVKLYSFSSCVSPCESTLLTEREYHVVVFLAIFIQVLKIQCIVDNKHVKYIWDLLIQSKK